MTTPRSSIFSPEFTKNNYTTPVSQNSFQHQRFQILNLMSTFIQKQFNNEDEYHSEFLHLQIELVSRICGVSLSN